MPKKRTKGKPKRRGNKSNIRTDDLPDLSTLSLAEETSICNNHGLDCLQTRSPIRLSMIRFQRECIDEALVKYADKKASFIFVMFEGWLEGCCTAGDLATVHLRKDEINKFLNRFISWGTDYLLKGEDFKGEALNKALKEGAYTNPYTTLACSLAMIAFVISEYSAERHGTFQSYIVALDSMEMIQRTEYNYLSLLASNEREVARFFSSITQCSCISSELTCPHGFPTPPEDDPIHIFRRTYTRAIIEEVKTKKAEEKATESTTIKGVTTIQENICVQLHEKGLSHLWNNEERAKRISSWLVSFGTECIHEDDEEWWTAAVTAICIKTLELTGNLSMRFKKETYSDILATNKWISSQQELAKFIIDSSGDPKRELAKFFTQRNGCSCLKQKYKAIKADQPKQGRCGKCNEVKDRVKLMLCQGCKVMNYCSKECQRADWDRHKEGCRTLVELSGHKDSKV